MKFVKGISLFVLYPVAMLSLGFLGGVMFMNFFYPGRFDSGTENVHIVDEASEGWQIAASEGANSSGNQNDPAYLTSNESRQESRTYDNEDDSPVSEETDSGEFPSEPEVMDVSFIAERITTDTEYVLEETDNRNQTVVETTWKIPAKYIGMNRGQFLEAMKEYEAFPPLSELERGFVSLEVLSFSKERVVVQMNYEYTQPSSSFYLMVRDNYVVVYLDDQETVYMYTDILLTELPDNVQQDIINILFVPDEESLYGFLETYSS